jgi:glycosyltransferase involved in cell wall biosynthesis
MKIVFLNPVATLGGGELSLLDIFASLREQAPGFELHLIVGDDGPLVARAQALGVNVQVLLLPESLSRLGDAAAGGRPGINRARVKLAASLARAGVSVLGYSRRLRQALRVIGPDLVHSNGFKMHVLAARSAWPGIPVIWHIRDYASSRPAMAKLLRTYANRPAAIVANSKSVAGDIRAVCGDGVRIETIYNAIDLNEFSPEGDRLDLDQSAGISPAPAGTVRVGLAGTLARWKGYEVFLRALASLPNELPVRGYIIGDALYQTAGSQYQLDELRGLAAELKLTPERIGFTGYTDRPAAALRALDIVVHASTQPEPFGRVVAEAMACGRALIASRAGGVSEIIVEGVDALAHEPGNAQELAAKLELLVRDPPLRERLGRAGLASAGKRFDRSRLAIELEAIYHQVVGAGREQRKS